MRWDEAQAWVRGLRPSPWWPCLQAQPKAPSLGPPAQATTNLPCQRASLTFLNITFLTVEKQYRPLYNRGTPVTQGLLCLTVCFWPCIMEIPYASCSHAPAPNQDHRLFTREPGESQKTSNQARPWGSDTQAYEINGCRATS